MIRKLLIISALCLPVLAQAGQGARSSEAQFFNTRSEGMSVVSKEIDALKQLITMVRSLPDERGRHRISFDRLLNDLDLIQKGVLQTINLPTTAPVQGQANYPALFTDYLE